MNIFVKICVLVCLFGITAYANGAAKMEKTPDFTELLGKEWKLASVVKGGDDIGFRRDSLTEDQNGYYTLSFDAQQINGTGAPNRYFSDYQQRAGDLSFGVIAGTKMFAFNEPEKLREHDYFAYLQGTSRWNLIDGTLKLYAVDEGGTIIVLTFTASIPKSKGNEDFTELLGKEWKLASVAKGGDDIGFRRDSLTEDQNGYYTLSFDAQRINGTGAPNRYFSDYQHKAGDLSFGVIAGTKMFAFNEPEKLREHDYFAYLQGTSRWNLSEGLLTLFASSEDGQEITLTFTAD